MNSHSRECSLALTAIRHGNELAVWCLMATAALAACLSATGADLEKRPQITTQPQSVSALAGRKAVLFARAYGAGKLTFQWMRDGVALPKGDEPVLRLDSLSAARRRTIIRVPAGACPRRGRRGACKE